MNLPLNPLKEKKKEGEKKGGKKARGKEIKVFGARCITRKRPNATGQIAPPKRHNWKYLLSLLGTHNIHYVLLQGILDYPLA